MSHRGIFNGMGEYEVTVTSERHMLGERERRERTMVCIQNTQCDTNEGGAIEVTVTSERENDGLQQQSEIRRSDVVFIIEIPR